MWHLSPLTWGDFGCQKVNTCLNMRQLPPFTRQPTVDVEKLIHANACGICHPSRRLTAMSAGYGYLSMRQLSRLTSADCGCRCSLCMSSPPATSSTIPTPHPAVLSACSSVAWSTSLTPNTHPTTRPMCAPLFSLHMFSLRVGRRLKIAFICKSIRRAACDCLQRSVSPDVFCSNAVQHIQRAPCVGAFNPSQYQSLPAGHCSCS